MSSKRKQRRHACSRKRKYTKDQAFNTAVAMRGQQPTGEPKYDAYPCQFCGGWHVGKRPKWVQKSINVRKNK